MASPQDFLYLSSMQELADWRPELAATHPANVANTPFSPRPSAPAPSSPHIPRLLVCHDFAGGYHPSESSQGLASPDRPYTAEHLSYIDAFVYFSHQRVSVPPAPWINTLHRAGVRVLGTLLFEHAEAGADAGRLFERGSEGEFLFATQLARLAETYGFDGWLLNVESRFPWGKFSPGQLQSFVRELTSGVQAGVGKHAQVIWYDAVHMLNRVHHQNGLTLLNAPFLAAASGLFTNYGWRPLQLRHTATMAAAMARTPDVYAGVDVYGRGSLGGGGFGSGTALEAIRGQGLSAALFAPGWTWEHFGGADFEAMDRRFWVGNGAGKALKGAAPPVAEYVRAAEAGTENGFYTNFNRGFGGGFWVRGKEVSARPWVHLGQQSLLPTFPSPPSAALPWTLSPAAAFTGAWSLLLTAHPPSSPSSPQPPTTFTPLYRLSIAPSPGLTLSYAFQLPSSSGESVGLYWDVAPAAPASAQEPTRHTKPLAAAGRGWSTGSVALDASLRGGARLVELGVFHRPRSAVAEATPVLGLGELCIAPADRGRAGTISSVVEAAAAEGESEQGRLRLEWRVYGSSRGGATGGFAYFLVWHGEEFVGVAFCCAYTVKQPPEQPAKWRVSGVTWEGNVVEGS